MSDAAPPQKGLSLVDMVLRIYWLAVLVSIPILVLCAYWYDGYQLDRDTVITTASVVDLRGAVADDYMITFEYEATDAQGNTHMFREQDFVAQAVYDAYSIGSPIEITYSRSNPQWAEIGTEPRGRNLLPPICVPGLFVYLWAAARLERLLKSRRALRQQSEIV